MESSTRQSIVYIYLLGPRFSVAPPGGHAREKVSHYVFDLQRPSKIELAALIGRHRIDLISLRYSLSRPYEILQSTNGYRFSHFERGLLVIRNGG